MKFINFDNYIEKMIMNVLIKAALYHNILVIQSFLALQDVQKLTSYLTF